MHGFVAVHDLQGRELWRREDPTPAAESQVVGLAVDPGTGQVCILGEDATDVQDWTLPRLWSTTCFDRAGSEIFSQVRSGVPGDGHPQLAIDAKTHQVFVSGPDERATLGTSTTALSADGATLWQRDAAQPIDVQELLVDSRRGLVHVVGRVDQKRVGVHGYDVSGAMRFDTTWRVGADSNDATSDAALVPRTGRVVVASLIDSRLTVQALTSAGRRAERGVVRGAVNNSQVSFDVSRARVIVSVNRRTGIHTSAYTLRGHRLWKNVTPTRGQQGASPGALDPRGRTFTYLLERRTPRR